MPSRPSCASTPTRDVVDSSLNAIVENTNDELRRAEPYARYRIETHALLPLTDVARKTDMLTRHVAYWQTSIREPHPIAA